MFNAYKIGVTVTINDLVTPALAKLVRNFAMAEKAAKGLNLALKGMRVSGMSAAVADSEKIANNLSRARYSAAGVKPIPKTGLSAAQYATGAAVTGFPVVEAIKGAAELQKQLMAIQTVTAGTTKEMEGLRSVIETIAGRTIFSVNDVAAMGKIVASGTGFTANQLAGLLPEYARFADVQKIMKGTAYEESTKEAIRLAHTAQHYDPESLRKYLDLLTKASFIVPGGLGEVGHALKYSQGIAKTALGVDDENMVLLTSLLNRLGFAGSRGGTNLIAAMVRTLPSLFGSGLLKGKSGEALRDMGMVDAQGHSRFFDRKGNFDAFKWMQGLSEYVAREFARMPEAIARQNIMKNFQHAFGTQGARVASLLGDPQALGQLRSIGATFRQFPELGSIQERFADESVWQQFNNAATNTKSLMTELGFSVLPQVSKGLTGVNHALQGMIEWSRKNQDVSAVLVKSLGWASVALGAAAAVKVVGVGLRFLGSAATDVLKALNPVVALVAGLTHSKDTATDEQEKAGMAKALSDPNSFYNKTFRRDVTPALPVAPYFKEPPKVTPPQTFHSNRPGLLMPRSLVGEAVKTGQAPQVHVDVTLDGDKVSRKVITRITKEAYRPQIGRSEFDPTIAPWSPALNVP